MSIEYKYLSYEYDNTDVADICKNKNNPHLPGGVIDKILIEFKSINGDNINPNQEIFIPILPPFQKKYDNLVSKEEAIPKKPTKPVEIKEKEIIPPIGLKELIPKPKPKKHKSEGKIITPTKRTNIGKLHFKLFPYTFSRPGETIEAVIRLYNDMNAGNITLKKLVHEFTLANPESMPPKLGQTVNVPVLLPFVYRHMNENKIFNDE